MSLKHAILGFLKMKPMNGYDLKKAFDQSIQFFWPANQSQIYQTLAAMMRDGWIEAETVERDERLPIKIYAVTEKGREELHNWLATPLAESSYREAFLIQIYFGGFVSDDEALHVVEEMLREQRNNLAGLSEMYSALTGQAGAKPNKREWFYSLMTLEYGISNTAQGIRFLESMESRIRDRDYQPKKLSELLGEG